MDEHILHDNDNWPVTPPPEDRRKPRIKWTSIAVFFIIIGAGLFSAGWVSGSRGGRIYFSNGLTIVPHTQELAPPHALDLSSSSNINAITVTSASNGVVFVSSPDTAPRVIHPDSRYVNVSEADGRLHVDVRSANNINILGINAGRTRIANFDSPGVTWHRTSATPFLDFNFDIANFLSSNVTNTVRIYVPDAVNEIEARSASGSIRMDGISTSSLTLQASSGRVTVEGGTHGNSRLQSASGSINGNAHFAGDLYARSSSGSINIQDRSISHRLVDNGIQLRSSSGSINFSTQAPISNFNYSISVSSGSIRVDDSRISGRRASGGNGAVPIDASASSGSIRLDFGQ